jgi:hypothetical protein
MAKLFYAISFAGRGGTGGGVLVFDDSGVVVGVDAAGVTYDGTFKIEHGRLEAKVQVGVPTGVVLVTGAPQARSPYQFPVDLSIPLDDLTNEVKVIIPTGEVRFQLRKLRETA